MIVYYNEYIESFINLSEFIINSVLVIIAFFELLVDVSETFGILIVASLLFLQNHVTIIIPFTNHALSKNTNLSDKLSISHLYTCNALMRILPEIKF